jgi:hypothetical protein
VAQAVRAAADETREAAVSANVSAQRAAASAEAIARHAEADRKAFAHASAAAQKGLADAIDARVKKAVREAGRSQSTQEGPPQGWRGVLCGVALGIFMTVGALSVCFNFSRTWFSDARLGAQLKRVLPSFDPAVRDKFIEQFDKHSR